MVGHPERKQRRIARRQKQILDAAASLFASKGYAGTTTREIAEAADVAEGTIYNYFGGKREILLAIAADMQATIRALLDDLDQLHQYGDMVDLVQSVYDGLETKLPFIRSFLVEIWLDDTMLRNYAAAHLEHMAGQIQRFISRRIESGVIRPVDPVLASRMALGMFTAPIFPALRGLADYPPPEERRALAEIVVRVLLDGLRVRPQEGEIC